MADERVFCRTDAGVHAIRNTFHMDCRRINRYTGQVRDPFIPSDVQKGLNFYLDPTKSGVNIVDVRPVGEEFHSRHSAKARTYTYRILSPLESVGSDIGRFIIALCIDY